MPDPITVAVVGGTVLVEGVKFLYGQASEVLKRWRARRDAAEQAETKPEKPETVEVKLTPAFEGQLSNPQIHFDAVKRLEGNLREVVKDLSPYATGIDEVDNSNPELMANIDALRRMLEAIYQQRITFKGEARPPSGTRLRAGLMLIRFMATRRLFARAQFPGAQLSARPRWVQYTQVEHLSAWT